MNLKNVETLVVLLIRRRRAFRGSIATNKCSKLIKYTTLPASVLDISGSFKRRLIIV